MHESLPCVRLPQACGAVVNDMPVACQSHRSREKRACSAGAGTEPAGEKVASAVSRKADDERVEEVDSADPLFVQN